MDMWQSYKYAPFFCLNKIVLFNEEKRIPEFESFFL